LYGSSFKTLGPLEAGLKINSISAAISEDGVYTSGRYFLGLVNSFITFPTVLETIEFCTGCDSPPLAAATREGQNVQLEVSFQFRLKLVDLLLVYRKYEKNYKANYQRQAEAALKNTSPRFSTVEYFTSREEIGQVFHTILNQQLSKEYAVVEHFQLRRVVPPVATDDSIRRKLIQQQQVETTKVNQQSTLVRAGTDVIVAGAQQEVNLINSRAASDAKKVVEEANALGIQIYQNATASAFEYLRDRLNYTNTELLTHFALETIGQLRAPSELVVDIESGLFQF